MSSASTTAHYRIYSRISRKIHDKILPEELGGDLYPGHKIKKFFQPPKYAASEGAVDMTNSTTTTMSTTMTAMIMLTFCIQYKS